MSFPLSRLARFELRRFRGPLPTIALVFVLCVPLLYAAIYLSANWDPYGRLGNLPVAVVNQDRPTTVTTQTESGTTTETIHAGSDFVTELQKQATFRFVPTTADEAESGLREGRYYLTIVVPPDFSTNLVSGQTDSPERAHIVMHRNDANGFVIGSITDKARGSVTEAVNSSAIEAYFRAVFTNLQTLRAGMVEAQQGASQLAAGLDDAKAGSAKLATGASQAEAGAGQLATGADSLNTGLAKAKQGSSQLVTGLDQLNTGAGQLTSGANQVAAGTQQLRDTVVPPLTTVRDTWPKVKDDATTIADDAAAITQVAAGGSSSIAADVTQANALLDQVEADNPALKDDPRWQQLRTATTNAKTRTGEIATKAGAVNTRAQQVKKAVDNSDQLSAKVNTAITDVNRLNDGAHQVATGATQLQTSIKQADTGARSLDQGLGTASSGASQVAQGAHTLQTGLGQLSTGATQLDQGLGKLQSGAHQLATGLEAGVKRIPVLSSSQQNEAVQVLSEPAQVDMTVENPATYYGRGLAPMFFSIAMWVFGISVFLVVRAITGRALAGRASSLRVAVTAWLPIGVIAAAGSLLMLGVVWLGLGLDPVHPALTVLLTVLGALAWSLVAHLLRTAMGTPGSSALLVLLILQLVGAEGLYPKEILPPFFAAISPWLPMTYLIDAYRVVISGGLMGHLGRDLAILAAFSVVNLGLLWLVVSRRRTLRMKDLHPPLMTP
ncbi:YhgE/Pip family protein [Aestuariimicrobium soli]|uniref:YhgE/Pip family protein n=1 Tax=Aestuariimicrobium soli TaxID=2035834 RepID=UPI003EBE90DD